MLEEVDYSHEVSLHTPGGIWTRHTIRFGWSDSGCGKSLGSMLIHIASLRLLAGFTLFLSLLESLLCRKGSELLSVSQRQGQFAQYPTVGDRNGA